MSEQDNLQTIQRAYKAFTERNLPTLLSSVSADVEFFPPAMARVPWAHPWRGRTEVEQYFRTLAAVLDFQEFEGDEFILSSDSVVVLGHERCLVRATGRVVEARWVQIFDFREGLICRHREYTDTASWNAGFENA